MNAKDETERLFNELWCDCEPYIRKLCSYKLNRMPQHIDDCVQEVFKALFEAMSNGIVIEHPKAWLSRVANNKIKDLYNKQKKEDEKIVPLTHEIIPEYTVDFFDSDNSPLSEEEILSAKQFVVEQLVDSERQLLNERFVQKKSTAEIALIQNTTEENIRLKIFRLKKKTKNLIKDCIKKQDAQKS